MMPLCPFGKLSDTFPCLNILAFKVYSLLPMLVPHRSSAIFSYASLDSFHDSSTLPRPSHLCPKCIYACSAYLVQMPTPRFISMGVVKPPFKRIMLMIRYDIESIDYMWLISMLDQPCEALES